MLRTFHSVGQGAFYTEEFDDFYVVYDCGTETGGIKTIENAIVGYFDKEKPIEILFISHFHRDHINGIEYLLGNYRVNNVVLPQYDMALSTIFFLENKNAPPFVKKFTLDPYKTIKSLSPKTKCIFVKSHASRGGDDQLNVVDILDDSCINSGTKLVPTKQVDWFYIAINHLKEERVKIFNSGLLKNNISIHSSSDFEKYWSNKNHKKQIVNIFNKLPGGCNGNSMVVYSGPEGQWSYFSSHFLSIEFNVVQKIHNNLLSVLLDEINRRTGCLYMGDYEANEKTWGVVFSGISQYKDYIGTVQIPHHGSKWNYIDDININEGMFSIISYGLNNKHGHPHAFTTASIEKNGGKVFYVNEQAASRLHFNIKT